MKKIIPFLLQVQLTQCLNRQKFTKSKLHRRLLSIPICGVLNQNNFPFKSIRKCQKLSFNVNKVVFSMPFLESTKDREVFVQKRESSRFTKKNGILLDKTGDLECMRKMPTRFTRWRETKASSGP